MTRTNSRRTHALIASVLLALSLALLSAGVALAEDETSFDLGVAVNAGTDTGYSESNPIKEDDPHFGWSLGQFSVSGFTSVQRGDGTYPTFLKTSGDTVSLNFRLDQDLNRLNGNDALSIADDANGYDEEFGVGKSDEGFGHGTLIIRQTNYQNAKSDPQVYNDYLTAVEVGANTQVDVFEEGDYEVALDYEVKNDPRRIPLVGLSILPTYTNYRIRFSFSVRNGNTMVFLLDSATGSELTNSSTTPNGFTIDLARSRYLDINVKREVLASDGEDLVEDTRYNGPARDGEQYTEPGIYTITATNPSTGQSTEKKINVGNDPVLMAYVTTGYSLDEIRDQVAQGAQIGDDGTITWPEAQQAEDSGDGSNASRDAEEATNAEGSSGGAGIAVVVVIAVTVVAGILVTRRRHRPSTPSLGAPSEDGAPTTIEVDVEPDDSEDDEGAER